MKYSKTAIRELNAKYRAVLKKMLLMNAVILTAATLATPAGAVQISEGQIFNDSHNTNSQDQNAAGLTITYGDALDNNGVDNVSFTNNSSVNSGGAMKALNGFSAGDNWTFDKNSSDKISGGLYIKIPNSGGENRTVSFGDNTTFSNNTSKWLGGALGIEAADTVTLGNNTTFKANHSDADGGGIAVWTDGTNEGVTTGTTLNLGQTNFDGNTANNRGGALANLNNDSASTAFSNTVNIGAGSTFTNNSAKMGGAIYNMGTMNISQASFTGNKTTAQGYGGAIFNGQGILTIDNSTFTDNSATWDGAAISSATSYLNGKTLEETRAYWQSVNGFDAANKLLISNSTFENNKVDSYSGGALGIYSDATITNSTFIGNNAGGNNPSTTVDGGGAIYVGGWGRVNIDGATFEKNSSNIGGAIATTHAGWSGDEYITVKNSTFTENTATEKGGAIANGFSRFDIENSTFTNNTSNGVGGAINNLADRTINLSGTNTFSSNMAGSNKNDIHNDGTLNISGTLALDGGITGNGTVNFADGTNLKTALLADAASNAIIMADTITGNINLVIENGSNGGQVKFDANENKLTVANSNALYNIEGDDTGLYSVTKKSSAEVAAATGVAAHHADTLVALTSGTSQNESFNAVSEAVNTLVQSSDASDVAAGVKAAAALAPSTTPIAVTHTTQNVNQIFSAVSSRLSSGSISFGQGESSGDEILGNGAVWAKALYNKTKLNTESGYDAHSRGLAVGAEGHIHDQVKIGVGYAYTNSDIKPDSKKAEVDSNSAILYAEYKPNNWFLNGIASYTWGRYDDHRYVLGTDVSAKYDVNSFSAQVQTGYDFHVQNYTLTPEIGLRYVNVDQKGFTDTLGNYTDGNKSDVLTGIIGATGKAAYVVSRDVTLKPELRLAATYDFVNDDSASVMTLANGSVVTAQGKTLKKLSGEVGFGLTAEVMDKVELGVGYEGKFRKHYQDHTGMITAKYNF